MARQIDLICEPLLIKHRGRAAQLAGMRAWRHQRSTAVRDQFLLLVAHNGMCAMMSAALVTIMVVALRVLRPAPLIQVALHGLLCMALAFCLSRMIGLASDWPKPISGQSAITDFSAAVRAARRRPTALDA